MWQMVLLVLLNRVKNMVLLLDILVGLSVVNVSGLFLYRLSFSNLLYIFLFLLFSVSVTLYCVNLRLVKGEIPLAG